GTDQIRRVLDEYAAVCESAANERNRQFWTNAGEPWLIERWRGVSARRTHPPFTMALDIAGYSTVLGIECPAYYESAEAQLYGQMRYHLWEAQNLRCNRFFDRTAFVSFGAAMAASLFGARVIFPAGQAPWVDLGNPVLKERDLSALQDFDLQTGGLAPRTHQFYQRMGELTEGSGIRVMYPVVLQGPFAIATQLRETTALLIDMLEAGPFVHDLMRTITDGLKKHATLRAEYLEEPIAAARLFNDEIGAPMLSRAMYEDFILPYELELAEFHGRVTYWHSCGVSDEFMGAVATIPNLEMMHVGPWSSPARAAEVFGPRDVALDICANATEDVYDRTPEEMRAKMRAIRQACEGKVRHALRADGFQIAHGVEADLAKIRQWNDAATEVFGTVGA
ncbi:MAG: uroporphyrinogen decarboxylase family protein, partial [Gemmatimonadota bacterium]